MHSKIALMFTGIILATPYNSPLVVTQPATQTVQVKDVMTPIAKPADIQATYNPQG